MFQKGFVIVFYQVKCFLLCDIECHPINLRIYPKGFPGLNWRGLLRQKHPGFLNSSQWSCQVQLPWGALWYSVIACVQLAVSIGLLRGPLRCSGEKTFKGFDRFSGWVGRCRFCYKQFWKKGTSSTCKGIFWVTSFNASRKNAHVTPWFGWSYRSTVFLMLVPSFALSAREFNGVVAASELLLLDFARKPVVPLAMDLVETRPTSSRVDTSQENGDGNHRKYHSNWRIWRF